MRERNESEESFDILVQDIFGTMIEEKNSDQKDDIVGDISIHINNTKQEIKNNSILLINKIVELEDFVKNDVGLEDTVKTIKKIDNKSEILLDVINEHSNDTKTNLTDLRSFVEASNSEKTNDITEALVKHNQELTKNNELLIHLLRSSDSSHKKTAKEILQAISDVSQLLNNNLNTLLSNIDENRQFTDDTYQKFIEVFQTEKEILLEHSSNLEKLFSEKNNYNISKLLEEISIINKLVYSKYDSLLHQIDKNSQIIDEKTTSINKTIEAEYEQLTFDLKSTVDKALIKSNSNYDIAQNKLNKISLSNKILITLNCFCLIAIIVVIFLMYSS
ncbi:hypothetical protein AAIR29_06405 [Psychrobacter sp. FBL11]|uniref:Uncharacterized protein n=1 Tax=Psychrobacter saeujeotis TaxID=3143436 RepID=A0ABU9XA92_9GAMM|nr:hypothetical protein [uncultured Psychrobacter sp.]